MATPNDMDVIRRLMKKVKDNPNTCERIGDVQITYSPNSEHWIITMSNDFSVIFDDIDYSSNNIILIRQGKPFGWFCHAHQRITDIC